MLSKAEVKKLETAINKFVASIDYIWAPSPYKETLDGDETQEIADGVLARLDFVNGNISNKEYDKNKIGGEQCQQSS